MRVTLLLEGALVVAITASTSFAQTFTATNYSVGPGVSPRAIVMGDLDHDGDLDAIVPNFTSLNFSVLAGNGTGGFGAATLVPFAAPFGTAVGAMGLADVNGDTNLDLIAAKNSTNGVAVLLGNGVGGFGAPTAYSTTTPCAVVTMLDLNADLRSDILATSYTNDEFHIFLATGGGVFAFGSTVPFLTPLGTVQGTLAVGDFNNDGKLDVASPTYYMAGVAVFLNNGLGGLSLPTQTLSGTQTRGSAAAGDIDNDGDLDLAVVDQIAPGGPSARFFTGDNFGNFTAVAATVVIGADPFGINLGDVTGDGNADLMVTQRTPDTVSMFPGNGAGGFGPAQTNATGLNPQQIAIGDLDADGRMDAVSVNSGSNNVTSLKNGLAIPAGVASYGTGKGGCNGILGIGANSGASVGNTAFAATYTNAPHDTLGLTIVANVQDLAGSDPFLFGVLFHFDVFTSTLLLGFNANSDTSGAGNTPLPIPNDPSLVGSTLYVQGIWVEDALETCGTGIFGAITTRGLSLTFF